MQVYKENNRNTFFTKQSHLRREKRNRVISPEEDTFYSIKTMTIESLLHLMEQKYDNLSLKYANQIVELNQAILSRISQLKDEFQAKHKKEFIDFLEKGGKKINDTEYQGILTNQSLMIPRNSRIIRRQYKNIVMLQTIIHEKDGLLRQESSFFGSRLPEECSFEISYKRLKKDSISQLTSLLELLNTIQEYKNSN